MKKTLTAAAAALAAGAPLGAAAGPKIAFETNAGDFTVELYAEQAPKTVANFLSYVDRGYYDGTVFHRVIPGFMAQGGGFEAQGEALVEKPSDAPIPNEADNGLLNEVGTLAMARTNDPHSASAQFFINVADNDFLNHSAKSAQGWGYAVFGKVVDGMGVVQRMAVLPTGVRPLQMRLEDGSLVTQPAEDVPEENVVIRSVRRVAE